MQVGCASGYASAFMGKLIEMCRIVSRPRAVVKAASEFAPELIGIFANFSTARHLIERVAPHAGEKSASW